MLELTADQSAIAASIIANIILNISIQLQKYAKREIIHLALYGLPSLSVERLWKVALSLLVISECTYYVWYGLDRAMSMTPMGVYTAISNTVLPPLLFECHVHTLLGTTCEMFGVLTLIFIPPLQNTCITVEWDASTKQILAFYIGLCLSFCTIRAYKPANCSLKLTANCGLSGLMGACSVVMIKMLSNPQIYENSSAITGVYEYSPLIWALIVIIFLLQLVLLSENLEFFPVWQVVPHHYILFSIFMFSGNVGIFHQYEQNEPYTIYLTGLAHILILIGVWISAKPHLDIPASIRLSNLMPQLEALYSQKYHRNPIEAETVEDRYKYLIESEHSCANKIYCELMHDSLKSNQGFSSNKHKSTGTPLSFMGTSTFYSHLEEEP